LKKFYLTQTCILRNLDKESYKILSTLSKLSKNMVNVSLYSIRQNFFQNGNYLNYNKNYHICKSNENYKLLGSTLAQACMQYVDWSFKSFFGLLKVKSNKGLEVGKISIPKYLPKDSTHILVWNRCGFKIINNQIRLSISKEFKKQYNITKKYLYFKLPKNIKNIDSIKEIRIKSYFNNKYFKLFVCHYVESINNNLDSSKALSIDFGINNLATCIDTNGTSFILDGKYLKSINRLYNKLVAKYKSILDKQEPNSKRYSKKLYNITLKRNNQINNYINHATKKIIDYCTNNKIGNLIIGNFGNIQNGSNLGKKNNQNFVQIPFGIFKNKLRSKCELNGIKYHDQEESYTSKCSFLDNEKVTKHEIYQGKRIKRGLFKTSNGTLINADVNAAANILKKYYNNPKIKLLNKLWSSSP